MDNLLNKLFPVKCCNCGKNGDIVCENCLSTCTLLNHQNCLVCDYQALNGHTHEKCKTPQTPTQFISVFIYAGLVRNIIRMSKYFKKEFIALKKLSYEGAILTRDEGYDFSGLLCLPIPISKSKADSRGFNQTELIADIFSKVFSLKKDYSILVRNKETHAQHDLSRKERFANLENAFGVTKNVKGERILLIDDISTTGATFLEAAKVLYKNGALEVKCFSLSKKLK